MMSEPQLGVGSTKKIFVGGLPQNCTEQVLSNYFMQYGTIVDSVVMKDRETGNSRGFGFITYDSENCVDMVMAQYEDHRIEKKWVEVKRAVAREMMPPGGAPGGKGGGRRGGGGGRDRSPGGRRSPPRGRGGGFGGGGGGGETRPGDWTCPRCGANVFASKDECYKCGTRKNGGGGESLGSPAMLGSPCGGAAPPLGGIGMPCSPPQAGNPYGAYPPVGPYGSYPPPPGAYGCGGVPPMPLAPGGQCGGCYGGVPCGGGSPYGSYPYQQGMPPAGAPPPPAACFGGYGAYRLPREGGVG